MTQVDTQTSILLIGPVPPPAGGARILTAQFVEYLFATETRFHHVNLVHRGNPIVRLWLYAKVVFEISCHLRHSSVAILFATSKVALNLGPAVWLLSRLFRKKCAIRLFGGRFDMNYESLSALRKWLIRRTILHMDLVLFETNMMVRYFRQITDADVRWHANSRSFSIQSRPPIQRATTKSFVYLGHVRPCKGIRTIIAAARSVGPGITIDVYGPLRNGITPNEFEEVDCVRYHGEVRPEDVLDVLRQYDALLLPTYCQTEGYPGVVLEAYSVGLPVIATDWNALSEIVEADVSGLLIRPRDSESLKAAMENVAENQLLLSNLRQGAIAKCREFSNEIWFEKLRQWLVSIPA